jgi:hypothetical protein
MIVAAVDGQENILLDATDKNADLNILPIRDLNTSGRMITSEASCVEIDLMPKNNAKEVTNIMAEIDTAGNVFGKIRHQYFDYNAYLYRANYNGVAKVSLMERLEKKYNGIAVQDYEVQNNYDFAKPIIENYAFETSDSVEIIGDKMYVSPFLFFALEQNPFKSEVREYPVDFGFPNQDKFNISLTIPQGYIIESLPQPKAIGMPDDLANFKYNISNKDNIIQLTYSMEINKAIIDAEYYEALKNFFKELVNKQTEKIVLKKG